MTDTPIEAMTDTQVRVELAEIRATLRVERRWSRAGVAISTTAAIIAVISAVALVASSRSEANEDRLEACARDIANRDIARADSLAARDYVDSVLEVIDGHVGIPDALDDELHELSAERGAEIDRNRPAYQPGSCPPIPITREEP